MSIIKEINKELIEVLKNAGYEVENINLLPSNRKDLGDFQINEAFNLAKAYGKNPRVIAEDIVKELEKDGLINRKEYQQIPPKVEYSLTQMGQDLKPVVKEIHNWILQYDIQG